MADISKITLPSGTTYDIKDSTARAAIAGMTSFTLVISTNAATTPKDVTWQSGSTTITGTLDPSGSTQGKVYLVPSPNGTKDGYDEYITVNPPPGGNFAWERFGHTDSRIDDLGALAFKDSASGSFTPAGTVSQPTFTGSSTTSTGSFTPSGDVSMKRSASGTVTTGRYITFGATTMNSTTKAVSVSGTCAGSVTAPAISVKTAGSTTTVNSITAVGTLPEWTGTVANENLTIAWSAGTLPTKGSNTTVKTGDAAYQATAPTFTGDSITSTGSLTSYVTGAQPVLTVSNTQPSSGTYYELDFSGSSGSVSVTGTPSGTVSQPTFTGTQGTVTVT